jgi:phosphomannomutase
MSELIERASVWAASDPDPETRAEIERLVAAGDDAALAERFVPELTFGTAGIRGMVGAGPARMCRAVVIRTTHAVAAHLLSSGVTGPVVVGFDARPSSSGFAEDAVGVLAAAGVPVRFFPEPTPTPLVAYTARILGASGAIVITASHNPPQDNGYKLYGANASQIIPPMDTSIEELIRVSPAASDVPRIDDPMTGGHELVTAVPDDTEDRYIDELISARFRSEGSDLRIVYTPMHGVGGRTVRKLLVRAGHTGMIPVSEQFEPDGTFPTVAFPNPEEPGALDLAMATARDRGADLVLANDPDADRLAVVAPLEGEWAPLSGNDLGALLGDYVLEHHRGPEIPIVVSSIVSSPMMERLADLRGARHESTLTGFKWIVDAGLALEAAGEGRFVFGYEEALGYTVGSTVRDKDGISAALVLCDLAQDLDESGRTLWDRLHELWDAVGVWASAQHSVTRTGPGGVAHLRESVERLAGAPPGEVSGHKVTRVVDYRRGAESRPRWLGAQELLELSLGRSGRVLVRPSGTEPKLKIYVDLTEKAGDLPRIQRRMLELEARRVAEAVGALTES